MVLQFDLAARVDRQPAIPDVLHHDVVHDRLAVEHDGGPLAHHADEEGVPLARGPVGLRGGKPRVVAVVPEGARAVLGPVLEILGVRRVPDLHLRAPAEVDPAVAPRMDFPVDVQLEVAVVLRGAEALSLAVEPQHPVDHAPVFPHARVGRRLSRSEFVGRHRPPRLRIADEPLPAGEITAVEERREPGGLLHDARERHLGAALAPALVGGLHEGVDLERLRGAHGCDARAEEPHDLHEERPVAVEGAHRGLAPLSAGGAPVALRLAKGARAAPRPGAVHRDRAVFARAPHRLASGAEHGEERLDAVDAIPEEVGVAGLEARGARRLARLHASERARPHPLRGGAVAQ